MLFVPSEMNFGITDGSAAPGTHAAPVNLRNFTPNVRGGGEISVTHGIAKLGRFGRPAGQSGYLRHYDVEISDLSMEQDDAATTGTTILFEMNDPRTGQERIYQVTYATGHTRTVNALVASVGDSFSEDDFLMYNVGLVPTGTLTEVGFD